MEGVGYLLNNDELLRKMRGTGWNTIKEEEVLEALSAAIVPRKLRVSSPADIFTPLVNKNHILVGVSPSVPLSSPQCSFRIRTDTRMLSYHNTSVQSTGSRSVDTIQAFLDTAKNNPSMFQDRETG